MQKKIFVKNLNNLIITNKKQKLKKKLIFSFFMKKKLTFFYEKKNKNFFKKNFFWSLTSTLFFFQKTLYFMLGCFISNGFLLKKLLEVINTLGIFQTQFIFKQNNINFFFYKKINLFFLLFFFYKKLNNLPEKFNLNFNYFFSKLSLDLKVMYRIVFISLSRRMKKIIKNKYKFRRQYLCVIPSARVRYGIHLFKFCLKFTEGKNWQNRFLLLISSFFLNKNNNIITFIKKQQQKKVLLNFKKKLL